MQQQRDFLVSFTADDLVFRHFNPLLLGGDTHTNGRRKKKNGKNEWVKEPARAFPFSLVGWQVGGGTEPVAVEASRGTHAPFTASLLYLVFFVVKKKEENLVLFWIRFNSVNVVKLCLAHPPF